MGDVRVYHVAVGMLRRGESLVLVQQQGHNDPQPYWALPGGVVESGELLDEALRREVQEETGIRVSAVGPLAYVTQVNRPQQAAQSLIFVFEVTVWQGDMRPNDPDGEVLQVALVPLAEALVLLAEIPFPTMREPLLAYLRGDSGPGQAWFYREE
ncbi:MAG: NUDIX hydrolase [Chloroflexaceae bacterium]|jgi:8-oxo-dGTP diphosphatase|nr:NUDIX hydrolase [Chloroflexaceae bacterium]